MLVIPSPGLPIGPVPLRAILPPKVTQPRVLGALFRSLLLAPLTSLPCNHCLYFYGSPSSLIIWLWNNGCLPAPRVPTHLPDSVRMLCLFISQQNLRVFTEGVSLLTKIHSLFLNEVHCSRAFSPPPATFGPFSTIKMWSSKANLFFFFLLV